MDTVLDNDQTQPNSLIEYSGFWLRVAASLIDFLVMVPFFVLSTYNSMKIKSLAVMLIVSFAYAAYKVLMEARYGATLGKMAVKIKVVNQEFGKIGLNEAIVRNVFQIYSSFSTAVIGVMLFNDPAFINATTFTEVGIVQQQHGNVIYSIVVAVILIGENLAMLADEQKRTIHDRIGKTYVIKSE